MYMCNILSFRAVKCQDSKTLSANVDQR